MHIKYHQVCFLKYEFSLFANALDKVFLLIILIFVVEVVFVALLFSYFKTADIFLKRLLMLILMMKLASFIRII